MTLKEGFKIRRRRAFIRWIAKKLGIPVWFEKTKEEVIKYVDREVKVNIGYLNHRELREVRIQGERFYSRRELEHAHIMSSESAKHFMEMVKRDVNVKFSKEFEEAVEKITDTTLKETFEGFECRKKFRFWISEEEYNKLGL